MGRHIPGEPAELVLAERNVPYRLQRSPRRRTVALTVDAERGLVVYAPQRMASRSLERILREKASWILAKIEEMRRYRELRPLPEPAPGNLLPWRGHWFPLAVEANGGLRQLREEGGVLWLGLPPRILAQLEAESLRGPAMRAQLLAAYRDAARIVLEQQLDRFAGPIGVRPTALRIKDQQRRWGSASARGALNFNWRLILAPPGVLDYVVVHELCHLRELNHSPRFWAHVAAALPDYRARQDWLRDHGPGLYDL